MTDKKKKLEKAAKVVNAEIVEEVDAEEADAEEFDDKEIGIVIETEVIKTEALVRSPVLNLWGLALSVAVGMAKAAVAVNALENGLPEKATVPGGVALLFLILAYLNARSIHNIYKVQRDLIETMGGMKRNVKISKKR